MPPSPFGHSHKHGDCYATWYAKKKAGELAGQCGFSRSDEEDIEQSLLLGLLERWPKFNSDECSPNEFISWAIGRGVADLIRDQQRRREFEPTETQPIEHLLRSEDEAVPANCVEEDHAPHLDLQMDLEEILSDLPPEIEQVGRLLMTGNISQAARQLGISRRTVRDRVQKLREALVAAGYEHA